MPFPLIPIVSALTAGGTLVPHATGGLIVTGAGGYVTGTFLSTAAISGMLTTASATLGVGALYLSGAAASIVGSAGIFGTTIGATGVTGALMSAGIISSTPVWIPLAVGGAALGCSYGGYRLFKLKRKLNETPDGAEAQFTATEAKIIEKIIKGLAKKNMWKSGTTETTTIGFINRNNQKVLGNRGIQGTDHGQFSYKLQCLLDDCGHEYGANGTDIFQRKCPQCQDGKPGIEY